jgi:hypothetical protein
MLSATRGFGQLEILGGWLFVTLSEAKGPKLFDTPSFSATPDALAPSLRSG